MFGIFDSFSSSSSCSEIGTFYCDVMVSSQSHTQFNQSGQTVTEIQREKSEVMAWSHQR